MDDTLKSKCYHVVKVTLLVLAIVTFVMVCTGIGKTGLIGFWPHKIEGVTTASSNENGTVIADSEGDRLLFINPSDQLVGMRGLDDKETPITTATVIRQTGEEVLVAGVAHAEDGESVKTEAVLKFNMEGDYLGVVWKKDTEEGAVQTAPSIRDITTDDKGNLILTQFGLQKDIELFYDGTVTSFPQNGGDGQVLRKAVAPRDSAPLEIRYSPKDDRCAMTNVYGGLFVERDNSGIGELVDTGDRALKVWAFDTSGDRAVLYDGESRALYSADNLFGDTQLQFKELDNGMRCNAIKACGDTVTTILDNGAVRIYDMQSGSSRELIEVPLVAPFAARSIVLSLSKAYLVVLFIVLAVRWLVHNIRQGRHDKVRRAIVATAVALICVAAMVFHMVDVFGTKLLWR